MCGRAIDLKVRKGWEDDLERLEEQTRTALLSGSMTADYAACRQTAVELLPILKGAQQLALAAAYYRRKLAFAAACNRRTIDDSKFIKDNVELLNGAPRAVAALTKVVRMFASPDKLKWSVAQVKAWCQSIIQDPEERDIVGFAVDCNAIDGQRLLSLDRAAWEGLGLCCTQTRDALCAALLKSEIKPPP